MIEVKGLTKRFGRKVVLNEINLDFGVGVYGLLGPNGAGKTTLMQSILGLWRIQRGDVLYDGVSIRKNAAFSNKTGYLPQKFGLFKELTVYDMMAYLATLKGVEKAKQKPGIEKCIEQVNLSDRIYDKVGSLSGGMVRRLGIAQALLGDPNVIIVDEPTAGLDPEERVRFKNLILTINRDKTVIISTHIVEDVEALCDHIVIIDKGKIIGEGNSESIRRIAENKVYIVSASQELNIAGNFFIIKREQINGENMLKVVSDTEQEGIRTNPTIEDGYMCRIKGLG
jgi:ABC-2 type transport system ATP-binding protein